eukprot:TRINITY_DN867_c0_g4_i1.p1 TRINITY_DN867_c0_g4~~TRINITY_DN867_c0_g4_i1.p1  ORF type:complete len:882 (+),score=146.02 TRINITY_DN867_c0_g4_i1:65-2710(+)
MCIRDRVSTQSTWGIKSISEMGCKPSGGEQKNELALSAPQTINMTEKQATEEKPQETKQNEAIVTAPDEVPRVEKKREPEEDVQEEVKESGHRELPTFRPTDGIQNGKTTESQRRIELTPEETLKQLADRRERKKTYYLEHSKLMMPKLINTDKNQPFQILSYVGSGIYGKTFKCKEAATGEVKNVIIYKISEAVTEFEQIRNGIASLSAKKDEEDQTFLTAVSQVFCEESYDLLFNQLNQSIIQVEEYSPYSIADKINQKSRDEKRWKIGSIVKVIRELAVGLEKLSKFNLTHGFISTKEIVFSLQSGSYKLRNPCVLEVLRRIKYVGSLNDGQVSFERSELGSDLEGKQADIRSLGIVLVSLLENDNFETEFQVDVTRLVEQRLSEKVALNDRSSLYTLARKLLISEIKDYSFIIKTLDGLPIDAGRSSFSVLKPEKPREIFTERDDIESYIFVAKAYLHLGLHKLSRSVFAICLQCFQSIEGEASSSIKLALISQLIPLEFEEGNIQKINKLIQEGQQLLNDFAHSQFIKEDLKCRFLLICLQYHTFDGSLKNAFKEMDQINKLKSPEDFRIYSYFVSGSHYLSYADQKSCQSMINALEKSSPKPAKRVFNQFYLRYLKMLTHFVGRNYTNALKEFHDLYSVAAIAHEEKSILYSRLVTMEAEALIKTGSIEKGKNLLHELAQSTKKNKWVSIRVQFVEAIAQYQRETYDTCLENLNKVESDYKLENDQIEGSYFLSEVKYAQGVCYFRRSEVDKAKAALLEGYEIIKSVEVLKLFSTYKFLLCLGLLHQEQDQPEKAKSYYSEALSIVGHDKTETEQLALLHHHLGLVNYRMRLLAAAEESLCESCRILSHLKLNNTLLQANRELRKRILDEEQAED